MAKKKKSLKGLGARYGIKIRKQYTKVHFQLKQKRTCPECGSGAFWQGRGRHMVVQKVQL